VRRLLTERSARGEFDFGWRQEETGTMRLWIQTHWVLKRAGGRTALIGAALFALALLAGCGAAGGTTNGALAGPSSSSSQHSSVYGPSVPSASGAGSSTGGAAGPVIAATPGTTSSQLAPQYLIKSLNVGMAVNDTRATAADLQAWIAANDPRSQSAGATYTQDANQYDVALTFQVEASFYPQIKSYLTSYAGNHKGKLLGLQESVQDVTGAYVDAQSRLANLRVEQGRLQKLMSQASSITDILTIEQRLTDVEGQIEQIEAQLNQLNGQTTFYTVQIQLTPLSTYVPPITQPWNPGVIFHNALSSAQAFGEGLLTVAIWLAVYAIYIIPLGVIIWLIVRFWRRRSLGVAPATTAASGGGAQPPSASM
jgi:hypothetical protein